MSWLSLLPPFLAIAVALWKKEVVPALLAALFCAEFLLQGFNPALAFLASIDRVSAVFASPDNTGILLFSLLIGALLALFREGGGVEAFVHFLQRKGLVRGRRSVALTTSLLGVGIFVESNLSVLASGIFARPLFERYRMSRARLAFLIDSTCAPVSILILLNAWGAYVLGLLEGYGLDNTVGVLLGSVPLNFYPMSILALVFYTAWSDRTHFTLASHEDALPQGSPPAPTAGNGRKRYFLLPLLCLVGGIVVFMLYTGGGSLIEGSGARSALYATVLAIACAVLLLRLDGRYRTGQLVEISFKGMGELLPLVTIVLLALALGASLQSLGTGAFVAGMITGNLPLWLVAPTVFLAAAIISFTTGTSWGTFALVIPVAIPVALATGLPPSLLLAAVLGGGVFGDHCSPISDSTLLSSLASGCDHLEHVRTQLPYALLAAALSLVLFGVAGMWALR